MKRKKNNKSIPSDTIVTPKNLFDNKFTKGQLQTATEICYCDKSSKQFKVLDLARSDEYLRYKKTVCNVICYHMSIGMHWANIPPPPHQDFLIWLMHEWEDKKMKWDTSKGANETTLAWGFGS